MKKNIKYNIDNGYKTADAIDILRKHRDNCRDEDIKSAIDRALNAIHSARHFFAEYDDKEKEGVWHLADMSGMPAGVIASIIENICH